MTARLNFFSSAAAAVSKEAWYSWSARHLVDESAPVPASCAVSPAQLIPAGGDRARLIFGHNVSYDRAREGGGGGDSAGRSFRWARIEPWTGY